MHDRRLCMQCASANSGIGEKMSCASWTCHCIIPCQESKGESPHIGRAGEGAESHSVQSETGPQVKQAREAKKTAPQADNSGERAEDQPRRPAASAINQTDDSNMDIPWQEVLVAQERQRADNAALRGYLEKLRAGVTKQLADQ